MVLGSGLRRSSSVAGAAVGSSVGSSGTGGGTASTLGSAPSVGADSIIVCGISSSAASTIVVIVLAMIA